MKEQCRFQPQLAWIASAAVDVGWFHRYGGVRNSQRPDALRQGQLVWPLQAISPRPVLAGSATSGRVRGVWTRNKLQTPPPPTAAAGGDGPQAQDPASNGFIERFHRSLLEEHLRIKEPTIWYETVEEMQKDLDVYLETYNRRRPHQGRGMKGRTRYAVFRAGIARKGTRKPSASKEVKSSVRPDLGEAGCQVITVLVQAWRAPGWPRRRSKLDLIETILNGGRLPEARYPTRRSQPAPASVTRSVDACTALGTSSLVRPTASDSRPSAS